MNNYKKSGVDIEAGYELVQKIKPFVKKTSNKNVLSSLGGFGGLYNLVGYKNPVLVSGTDGVGTKLLLAIQNNQFTIGQDLVAMCVNDIITSGAKPLFFLDYFATGKLNPTIAAKIVEFIANACGETKTALIGGETAEMPGLYKKGHFDLAGFAVGVVEKDQLIDINNVEVDDVIIGLSSSGPHSNGFSLIRDIIKNKKISKKLMNQIMEPTTLYVNPILDVIHKHKVNAMAHITGGGFYENIPRAIPKNMGILINKKSWKVPKVFQELQRLGTVDEKEMYSVFNMGIGFIIIANKHEAKSIIATVKKFVKIEANIIGSITDKGGTIEII